MFGGPPRPRVEGPTRDRDPMGDYKLVHDLAVIGEQLFDNPGQVVDLHLPCPVCAGGLVGKANQYTRSVSIWCQECTFKVSR